MKLKVRSDLLYDFPAGTEAIVSIQAAASPDQTIVSESLLISPNAQIVQDLADERGERRFRAVFSGETRISYEAVVDNGLRISLPPDVIQRAWCDLPQDALLYLTASRYCPSDKFIAFAKREFGAIENGGARVRAVLDWIHANVDYIAGISDSETTAERTFVDRAGVCRDFSHLGITLCRALNIPARAVSAYAWKLDPPDFHAVFEVYLGGGWWLVDPTRLAPIDGLVRVGIGRDAADIAFLTTNGPCQCLSQSVAVEPAPEGN
ncbi:MAG: transglutaminase family protein [Hyphomonadaceae bacterium]|nr:transglutaminase family protein [Hyphomonadaceae bacterium]